MAHIKIRKRLMSVISPPAILGPAMAVPIFWAPDIFFFWRESTCPQNSEDFGGQGGGGRAGGSEVPIFFFGRGGFF